MNARPSCSCPVCELEYALLSELNHGGHKANFELLIAESSTLSAFPTANDLLTELRHPPNADDGATASDEVLGELIRLSRNPHRETARQLVLLILMPAIHRTSSQIAYGFPSLSRDDIAQHILTSVLDIISSQTMAAQSSHVAFAVTRAMRRTAFRWAIREADRALTSNLDETSCEELSTSPSTTFEPGVLLGEFLSRCLSAGLLTPSEHELLMLFKIQGVSSEVLAAQQQISDVAFRHRMQRVIERLRQAARGVRMSDRPANTAVA